MMGENLTVNIQAENVTGDLVKRDKYVGFTREDYEKTLRERLEEIKADMRREHGKDLRILELEKAAVEAKLHDLQRSYQDTLKRLKETEEALRRLSNELPQDKLIVAYEALSKGDTSKADALFAEVESDEERIAKAANARAADAAFQRGRIAYDDIRWIEARRYFDKAHRLEPENPLYATETARLTYALGEYNTALPLLEKAVALYETYEGLSSVNFANALNNLAELHRAKGNYIIAEQLYLRAIVIYENTSGENHHDFAKLLNNFAELHRAKGDYDSAEPLYRRALLIFETALGSEHLQVAIGSNNLALLHQAKGDLTAAEPLYRHALMISEKALGPEHPNTAIAINNAASLLQAKGDLAAAMPLYQRALMISEKALGPDHPNVAAQLNNLAILLAKTHRLAEAVPMMKRAAKIRLSKLGPEHPSTKDSVQAHQVMEMELMMERMDK